MLYTIANLLVGGIADKKGNLNCVFFDEDGSTFATDRMCFVVVEPSKIGDEEFRVADVEPVGVRESGVAVPAKFVDDVLKTIPKQPLRMAHRQAALTRCDSDVQFATTKDGVSPAHNSVKRVRSALPDIRAFMKTTGSIRASVCVSLKRLKKIVDTFDKMCGGDDDQPLYVELGTDADPVCLRARSNMTGQRLIGVMVAVEPEGWLQMNKWERKLFDTGVKKKKKAVVGKDGKIVAQRRHR